MSKNLKLYIIHCRRYLHYITHTSIKKQYKLDLPPLQAQRVGSKFMCSSWTGVQCQPVEMEISQLSNPISLH